MYALNTITRISSNQFLCYVDLSAGNENSSFVRNLFKGEFVLKNIMHVVFSSCMSGGFMFVCLAAENDIHK